jgi:hypothetical protein
VERIELAIFTKSVEVALRIAPGYRVVKQQNSKKAVNNQRFRHLLCKRKAGTLAGPGWELRFSERR